MVVEIKVTLRICESIDHNPKNASHSVKFAGISNYDQLENMNI